MFSLKQKLKAAKARSSGFTIVELLIVIVVIGILATLVIVTFSGIQQKGRNSQRQTDINAVASHVEAYYAETGTYPTAAMLNDSALRAAKMKGLDPEALKDPKATGATIGAVTATDNQYGYVATIGGAACPAATGTGATLASTCDGFTLTAQLEGGTTYTKNSNQLHRSLVLKRADLPPLFLIYFGIPYALANASPSITAQPWTGVPLSAVVYAHGDNSTTTFRDNGGCGTDNDSDSTLNIVTRTSNGLTDYPTQNKVAGWKITSCIRQRVVGKDGTTYFVQNNSTGESRLLAKLNGSTYLN